MNSKINWVKIKTQETFGKYKVYDYLNYLRKSQFFSKEKIKKNQDEKLRRLISLAEKNTKFYSNFFKKNGIQPFDIKSKDDLIKLPIMTKEIYRKIFPEDITNFKAKKRDLVLNTTSGSTGSPFKFYMSQDHRGQTAARVLRYYEWANRQYGESFVKIWGAPHLSLKIKLFNRFIDNVLLIDAFNITNQNFLSLYKSIIKKKAKLLEAYTSGAYAFALLMKEANLSINIPSTILSGETLYKFQIDIIEERFNTKIYNRYGCREFGAIAQECSKHEGLHISQEDFIIEIVNEKNQPVNDGEKGNIIITCLDNTSMPFIRYKIDDIGLLSTKNCSCGRQLKTLELVEGRVSDMIDSPSGRHISLYFFALVFQVLSDYVKEFQVIQKKSSKELILNIVPTKNFNRNIEMEIISEVKKMDESLEILVEIVEEIPLESNGKKKYLKII